MARGPSSTGFYGIIDKMTPIKMYAHSISVLFLFLFLLVLTMSQMHFRHPVIQLLKLGIREYVFQQFPDSHDKNQLKYIRNHFDDKENVKLRTIIGKVMEDFLTDLTTQRTARQATWNIVNKWTLRIGT